MGQHYDCNTERRVKHVAQVATVWASVFDALRDRDTWTCMYMHGMHPCM